MDKAKDQACDPDLDRLAEDWVALWQSELAGIAADPEVSALSQQWMGHGLGWWRMLQSGWPAAPPSHDQPASPPRSAAAASASGAGGGQGLGGAGLDSSRPEPGSAGAEDTERLRARITELESRLAEHESRLAALEGRPAGGSADSHRPRRRRTPA